MSSQMSNDLALEAKPQLRTWQDDTPPVFERKRRLVFLQTQGQYSSLWPTREGTCRCTYDSSTNNDHIRSVRNSRRNLSPLTRKTTKKKSLSETARAKHCRHVHYGIRVSRETSSRRQRKAHITDADRSFFTVWGATRINIEHIQETL